MYALHAPEVECIAKGKARTPYEFGVKVSIVTTLKEGLVVGARSVPGTPYDGHTLHEALEQAEILSEIKPVMAFVDRGYRGVEVAGVPIWKSGQRRGVTRGLKAMIKRRSAIEPTIGHMKIDGKLGRNWLKEHWAMPYMQCSAAPGITSGSSSTSLSPVARRPRFIEK